MLAAVKGASARYRKDMEEENMRKRKAEEEAVVAAEMKKKKEEFDAQKKTWQEKKDEVKAHIKKVEGQIDWATKEAEGAIRLIESAEASKQPIQRKRISASSRLRRPRPGSRRRRVSCLSCRKNLPG